MPTLDRLYAFAPASPWMPFPDAPACARQPHDVLVVLGCPSNTDGSASDCQKDRVRWARSLQRAGVGERFIVTGAAAHNAFVEAESMAQLLLEQGVPAQNVYIEPQAEHTDENIYYASLIMQNEGWQSAIVVSDPNHLTYLAACDANCCVQLGRLSTMAFATPDGDVHGGHYVLTPPADPVTQEECRHLRNPSRLMCTNFDSRRACAGDLKL